MAVCCTKEAALVGIRDRTRESGSCDDAGDGGAVQSTGAMQQAGRGISLRHRPPATLATLAGCSSDRSPASHEEACHAAAPPDGAVTVRQQWWAVAAMVLLLGAGLGAATYYLGDELFPVTVGSAAPEFDAATIVPPIRRKRLADYEGQVVLLNIWATWCAPCRVEMPSIQALHETYGPQGLAVVAVSIDDAEAAPKIAAFARDYRLTFEILHDASGAIKRTFQTTGVPETFVIAPDGVIRKKVVGAEDWNSAANRALIAHLLGIPVVPQQQPALGDTALSGATTGPEDADGGRDRRGSRPR